MWIVKNSKREKKKKIKETQTKPNPDIFHSALLG